MKIWTAFLYDRVTLTEAIDYMQRTHPGGAVEIRGTLRGIPPVYTGQETVEEMRRRYEEAAAAQATSASEQHRERPATGGTLHVSLFARHLRDLRPFVATWGPRATPTPGSLLALALDQGLAIDTVSMEHGCTVHQVPGGFEARVVVRP